MKVSQMLFHLAIWLLVFSPINQSHAHNLANDVHEIDDVNGIINFKVHKLASFGKLDKVVIDAGHGGKDHGCSGSHSKEKFIVLDIALKLGDLIRFYHPEIEIIYTRDTDVFIPLDTRIQIANKNKADLFISIHANYISKSYVRGTETYVMGLHRAEENLAVAKRENSAILYETDYESTYGGYDPNSSEAHILLSMYQNAYLDKSINFATKVENSFTTRTILKSRGVKQAGFLVLRKATMPSALIETGFLSSSDDESYLLSEQGQDDVANAILKAITEYKREVEGEYWLAENAANEQAAKESSQKAIEPKTVVVQQTNTSSQTKVIQKAIPSEHSSTKNHSHTKTYSGATGIQNSEKVLISSNQVTHTSHQPATPKSAVSQAQQRAKTQIAQANKVYRIQIAAGKKKLIKSQSSLFASVGDLEIRQENEMYKYLTGHYYDLAEAYSAKETMLKRGFKGAFVVAYVNDQRIGF